MKVTQDQKLGLIMVCTNSIASLFWLKSSFLNNQDEKKFKFGRGIQTFFFVLRS